MTKIVFQKLLFKFSNSSISCACSGSAIASHYLIATGLCMSPVAPQDPFVFDKWILVRNFFFCFLNNPMTIFIKFIVH